MSNSSDINGNKTTARHGIIVLGMGSLLMGDEGVGIHVVRALGTGLPADADVELIEAGTAGMRAVHAIAGRRKAIFIDCAIMKLKPGTIRRFTPENVRSRKTLRGFSTHEGDLMELIALSRRLGECPPDVVLFGIEPARIEQSMNLSPEWERRMKRYIGMVREELERS
jgi:hydrogenase maturation protease